MQPRTRSFIATLAACIATPVFAHGANGHESAPGTRAASTAEQKAFGIAGDPARVGRTIDVTMNDQMRFVPAVINVRQGETIRFAQRNIGNVMHEMVLGTRADLERHAALMRKAPKMEHDEPHMSHVAAGKRGEIVWHFNRAGEFEFACLIPGHFEAGMRGTIRVAAR